MKTFKQLMEDEAFKNVVAKLKKQHGDNAVLASKKDFDDHKKREAAKPKPKPKKQKPLTADERAKIERDVRYPPESPGTKRNYGD